MSSWRELCLRDLAEIKHGYAFKGEFFSDIGPGPILLTPGNFAIGGGFKAAQPKYYRGPIPQGFKLSAQDLVVTMTDLSKAADTLGYAALVPGDREYLHNQRIGLVTIADETKVSKEFLYYLLRTPKYRDQVLATSSGSTVRHTSPRRILDFTAPIPSLEEQARVAGVLMSLDDKLAANDGAATACHELAQALSVEAHAGASFAPLSDIAFITMGSSPPGKTYNERGVGVPFYQGTRDFGGRFPGQRVWCTAPVRTADAGSTLVSVRAPVGEVNVAVERCCIGRGIAAITSRYALPSVLFHELAGSQEVWRPYEADGTVFGSINKIQLQKLLIRSVTGPDAVRLEANLSSLDRQVEALFGQSQVLRDLRDALLPRLMSGEIRVREAEKIAEDAT